MQYKILLVGDTKRINQIEATILECKTGEDLSAVVNALEITRNIAIKAQAGGGDEDQGGGVVGN